MAGFFDRIKAILQIGTTDVSNSNPVPISDAGGVLTVDGTVAVTNTALTTLAGAVAGTEMQVDVLTMPSVGVTNSGLTALAGAIAGTEVQVDVLTMPASAADDADFTQNTTNGIPAMGVYEVSPTNVTNGDLGIVGLTFDRRLKTSARADENSFVDGSISVLGYKGDNRQPATDYTNATLMGVLKQISYMAQNPAAVTISAGGLPALSYLTDSIEAVLSATDNAVLDAIAASAATMAGAVAATHMQVDVLTMPADPALTDTQLRASAVPTTLGTGGLPALSHTTDSIAAAGTVADDAVTPGNPVMTGGKAVATDGTDPTGVAEDDAAIFRTDLYRRQLVSTVHPRLATAFQNETVPQTNHPLVAAPGAGLAIYITDLIISNGAVGGSIYLVEDTAGTPVQKAGTGYFGITGGMAMPFNSPIRITPNKDLGFTSVGVTTHSVTVNYYIAP